MDINSFVETIDLFFGPVARIIGYITTICGALFAIVHFAKKIIKSVRKRKNNPTVVIEACPKQKPKIKCS